MIDKEATIKKFGYNPDDLKPFSNKKVCCVCSKCGKIRNLRKSDDSDLCNICSGKKLGLNNKGRIPNKKTRKKLSEAGKKRKHSEETKRKISEGNKGKKYSEEQKRKIGKASKGRICSEETRKKMSESMKKKHAGIKNPMYGKSGKKSPTWQGGKSFEPYCSQFTEEVKEKVREKYNRKCIICGKTEKENGRKLCVHHIDYNKQQGCDNHKWKLIPLCSCCHGKTNYNKSYWEKYLKEVLL